MFRSPFAALLTLALAVPAAALAAEGDAAAVTAAAPAPTWHVDVETDPSVYFMGGFSAVVGVKPAPLPHWRFSAAVASFHFPEAMMNMNPENQGWGAHVRLAGAATAHYLFSPTRSTFFVGPMAMIQNLRYTYGDAPGQFADVNRLMFVLQGGYQWLPLDSIGLYVMPWVGVATGFNLSGEPRIGDKSFREAAVSPAFAIHLGYEF